MRLSSLCMAAVLIAPASLVLAADDERAEDQANERRITLDELPQLARETILREADGKEILEVEAFTFRGENYFEAEWRVGDMEVDVVVTPDGEVVQRETEPIDDDEAGDDD